MRLKLYNPLHFSTLLEGQVETAAKGASLDFMAVVDKDVMGNGVQNSLDMVNKSSASQQRDLNHRWQTYGAVSSGPDITTLNISSSCH